MIAPARWLLRRGAQVAEKPARQDPLAADTLTAELLSRVRVIEIKARRLVDEFFLGEYHAVFRGRGIEFDEIRPYHPGDDARDIDWKTFARTGEPFSRRYREDRDLTVLFAVDVSASQQVGALPLSKADLAAELCAVLALAAIRNNDRVGLLLFAGKPERYVRPRSGVSHVLRVVREVLSARPESRATDLGAALEYLTSVHRRHATVFLLSDFLASGYDRELRAAARYHDIVAIRVREPVDMQLPASGTLLLQDTETGEMAEVALGSPAIREAHRQYVGSLDDDRRRLLGELHIDEIPVMVGEDYVPALLRFFRRRAAAAAS
jgi:uncharacterized protein (DUF58 family)